MHSLSSSLMLGTTLHRNEEGVSNKLRAQVGYALIAVVAAVETVVALAFSALTLAMLPCSSGKPLMYSVVWLSSSVFSLGWSLINFCLNPFAHTLVADEKTAWRILQSGDLMRFPAGALIHANQL